MIEENEVYAADYKEKPMVLQLHKILDSKDNPVELHTVITDDQWEFDIEFEEAEKILHIMNTIDVRHRKKFLDYIQNNEGVEDILQNLDTLYNKVKHLIGMTNSIYGA